jgi:erythromycin esterase-like protein
MQVKAVRPALTGSYERLCHDTGDSRFLLPLGTAASAAAIVRDPDATDWMPKPSSIRAGRAERQHDGFGFKRRRSLKHQGERQACALL